MNYFLFKILKKFLRVKEESFFKEGYLIEYPEVAKNGIDPFYHYVTYGKNFGYDDGNHPSAEVFYAEGYKTEYPDLANLSNDDLWRHYCLSGKNEGRDNGNNPQRDIFDKGLYEKLNPQIALEHNNLWKYYVTVGILKERFNLDYSLIKASSLFDEVWYVANNQDVDFDAVDPVVHYLTVGWKENRDPSLKFSGNDYLTYNSDIKELEICPLLHYEKSGKEEGRIVNPALNRNCIEAIKYLKGKGKKVLFVSHEMTYTGAPLSILFAAKILIENGYGIAVLAMKGGDLENEFSKLGIPCIHNLNENDAVLLAGAVDTVIVNTLVAYRFYEACSKVAPTIWWVREPPDFIKNDVVLESVFRKAHNIYAMCDYSKNQFIEYNPDIQVIKHGMYDEFDKNIADNYQKLKDGKVRFSCLGSYDKRKGMDILVKAINLLPKEIVDNCFFLFAGNISADPDYAEYLGHLLKDEYKGSVVFSDKVTQKNKLDEIYCNTDCFIVPSREEPTSRVVIEGMMHGKPSIVSNHVGAQYLVTDDTGYIFDSENSIKLAEYIATIYQKITANNHNYFKSCRAMFLENNSVDAYYKALSKSINKALTI